MNIFRSRFVIEESDVKKIVDVSCAIPEGRKESYTKGLMFGFSGDFFDGAKYPDSTDRKCSKDIWQWNVENLFTT